MRNWIIVVLLGVALLAQGCSEFEPKHGTRVTFAFEINKPIEREQLVAISEYLIARGRLSLGVKAPRVDDYSADSLVLLLPGKRIATADVRKLIQPYSIELYHLAGVATERHPNRPWKIKVPASPTGPYLLVGPNARLIDSHKEPGGVRNEVLGHPTAKPILTGRDILPSASVRQVKDGWAVLVRFNDKGAKTFYEFTKANRGEYLAVFYNGRLVSAPIIKQSIPGGEAYITGFAKQDQAHAIVSELNAGEIPLKVRITRVQYY